MIHVLDYYKKNKWKSKGWKCSQLQQIKREEKVLNGLTMYLPENYM